MLNGEKYIKEAIDSVLEQEGALELEYIIVDGGSTDRTLEILEEYEELYRQGSIRKISTCAVAIWLGAAIKQQKYNSHILPSVL